MMTDDGIFVNLEIGDVPIIPKQNFRGGKWRERHIAKKCAAKRLSKVRSSLLPSTRDIFSQNQHEQSMGHEESEEIIIPTKRRRKDHEIPENLNVTNTYATKFPKSHDLNREVVSDASANNLLSQSDPKLIKKSNTHDHARSAFISGKLPAGSINIGGVSRLSVNKNTFSNEGQETALRSASFEENLNNSISDNPKRKVFEDAGNFDHLEKSVGSRDTLIPKKSGQIVSSLFSYNPSSKNKCENPDQETRLVEPSNAPLKTEMDAFTAMGLSPRVATHLSSKLKIEAPTAIQKAAIPIMIKGNDDAFIQAETGSGKTLAYLLPIVERIIAISSQGFQISRSSGLFAVILAPTRELCKQIDTVLGKLLRCAPWIVGTTVIGGESKQSEKARIRKGINILIATPGRLSDHLKSTEVLKVNAVRWLVLDEGDRLMELGFEEEIRQIIEKMGRQIINRDTPGYLDSDSLPKKRVNILCSATMKMNVQRLGEISLKDAIHIVADPTEKTESNNEEISESSRKFSAPAQLKQAYAIVPAKLRLVTLTAILKRAFSRRGSVMKAIVFISCADSVDFHFSIFSRLIESSSDDSNKDTLSTALVTDELTKDTIAHADTFSNSTNNVTLFRLHGSLAQNIRTATLKAFTISKDPCLMLCTDVASRGLDLPNVDYIIEYDPPFCADDHLHRVGRTARAGRDGRALILLLPGDEEEYISILASNYREGKNALTPTTAECLLQKGFGGVKKEWEERATNWQLEVERWVQDSPKYLDMARRGFQSHIRAYATHVTGERHIFNIQTLHLGHLAKAFALRDKPGSIKVPGLHSAKKKKNQTVMESKSKMKFGDEIPGGERVRKQRKLELNLPKVDSDDAYKRMKKKTQELISSANEFNVI